MLLWLHHARAERKALWGNAQRAWNGGMEFKKS